MVPPKKPAKPEVPNYSVDHDGDDGKTRIILHKHLKKPHAPTSDKAVTAFFENWEEPIAKWEPTTRPAKRFSVITRNPDAGKSFVLNEEDFLTKGTQSEKWPFAEMENLVRDGGKDKTTLLKMNPGKADPITVQQTSNPVKPAALKPMLKSNTVPATKPVPIPTSVPATPHPILKTEPVPKPNLVKPGQITAVPTPPALTPGTQLPNSNALKNPTDETLIQPGAYFTLHANANSLKSNQNDKVDGKDRSIDNKDQPNKNTVTQQVPKEIDLYGSSNNEYFVSQTCFKKDAA